MNPVTHLVVSLNICILIFYPEVSMVEIALFALVFSAFLDIDMLLARELYKPYDRLRTWFQEPAGLLFVGVPIGYVLAQLQPYYFWLTVVPYGLHIVLDYLSTYRLSPLSPFHDYSISRSGLAFAIWPPPDWQDEEDGVSELFLLIVSLMTLAYVMVNIV